MTAEAVTYKRNIRLYPKQRRAIFSPARYSIVEASTKAGKTIGCLVWILDMAGLFPGKNVWWISPVYAQAAIAYRRLKKAVRDVTGFRFNETDMTVTLPNDCIIWFKSAEKPDNLYGEDVYAAVVDEATRCKEAAWFAIRSTLTYTKGQVRIIGNVTDSRNWAYRMACKAKTGAFPEMEYHRITAYDAVDAGVLDAQEIADAKEQLPEHVFKALYLAEAPDEGLNPFGLRSIDDCLMSRLSDEPAKVYGVDLAKSVDYTVVIGLDKFGRTASFDRWQGIPWEKTIERIAGIVGQTPCLVDSTGVGDPVLEQIQKVCLLAEGFKFTATSRQQLLEGLAVAIQHQEIRYPEGIIPDELRNFEYVFKPGGVKYAAPEGYHDDTVMALALANRLHFSGAASIVIEGGAVDVVENPFDFFSSRSADDIWVRR